MQRFWKGAMQLNKIVERLKNGIITENPTFVLMLGMCPTLAVTTSAINGMGMGLTTMVILTMSNFMISLLRKVIPNRVRIPAYIVIVASFVTIVQFLLEGFIPSLYDNLGIYIPLIVVNCIILGRAESYASKNEVVSSVFDGIGMGLGFTIGLTLIGMFREILGSGSLFNIPLLGEDSIIHVAFFQNYQPITIFILAPGAFFVLAALTAIQNKIKLEKQRQQTELNDTVCRGGDCQQCGNGICGGKFFDFEENKGGEE